MKTQLYIPKKLKIGFDKRTECFGGKLAYCIYYDDQNILRKQTSWENWRDKTIEPLDLDNEPQTGFFINKDVKRFNWSHFSSTRTMIRIFDPRGFEFEITTENLIGLLMESDCNRRGFSGSFVLAWAGKELVLLPTSSEEYIAATKFTALQATKVTPKDLKEGYSYRTKKQEDWVYIGRQLWYDPQYCYGDTERKAVKKRVFYNQTKQEFFGATAAQEKHVSIQTSDGEVANFAEILNELSNCFHANKIVGYRLEKTDFDSELKPHQYSQHGYSDVLKRESYFALQSNNVVQEFNAIVVYEQTKQTGKGENIVGYRLTPSFSLDLNNFICSDKNRKEHYYQGYDFFNAENNYASWGRAEKHYPAEEINNRLDLHNLYVTFENGREIAVPSVRKFFNQYNTY